MSQMNHSSQFLEFKVLIFVDLWSFEYISIFFKKLCKCSMDFRKFSNLKVEQIGLLKQFVMF